jgi:nucleoside-diphosphate-sugar epimerase
VLPRIIDNLRQGAMRYPGGGESALNTIYVENLIDAIFLAAENEKAVGETFNLTDGERVTKRQFIETIAHSLDLPYPTRRPPLWLAWTVTWFADRLARMRGVKEAPMFNFTRLKFMGYNLDFSIQKAMDELGYRPRVKFDDAIAETLAWYKNNYVSK